MTTFDAFFQQATGGLAPYPYQRALAEGRWTDLLEVPTGLGKTAAVTLAWLYRRRVLREKDTPRRLVWCLPMRVLVEQTRNNIDGWLSALGLSTSDSEDGIAVHQIMGGEPGVREAAWTLAADRDAILIGTQDMLLSRALMRGYGMSRYQWPVHFALLHNDAQWVFDEVQLMGPAVGTSAQLEGLRRSHDLAPARPARTLWLSATLNAQWLDTVDLRPWRERLVHQRLGTEDTALPEVRRRREARKGLQRARTRLTGASSTAGSRKAYAAALAEEVVEVRDPGATCLVVLNTVERAQLLFDELNARLPDVDLLLVHGRFRQAERRALDARLTTEAETGRVIVATQAIEAGVDLSSLVLVTELAPWSSLVQRFGRCNRYGEFDDARVLWIDTDGEEALAPPYEAQALAIARTQLEAAESASPADLAPTDAPAPKGLLLRRRDLLELFNTDPDLSGFDVDISPYLRDLGTPQLQVFWRDFDGAPESEAQPTHAELCNVSLAQARQFLGGKRRAWTFDALDDRWRPVTRDGLRAGMTLLLRAADGGYDAQRGFSIDVKAPVPPIVDQVPDVAAGYGGDADSTIGCFVELTDHLRHVADAVRALAESLELGDETTHALITAAAWHDVGKAHPAFQHAIAAAAQRAPDRARLWAKSDGSGRLPYAMPGADGELISRPHFRHELASMIAWIEHGAPGPQHDLIAYLIAAHHGKVRLGLRALPRERKAPPGTRFARGVWDGDELPTVPLQGVDLPGNVASAVPATTLRLDLMELGHGEQGPSWTSRTQRLLTKHGPFELAWLEALVRIADWRASRAEQRQGAEA